MPISIGRSIVVVLFGLLLALEAEARPANTVSDSVADAERLYAEGASLFNQGQFREALGRFLDALELVNEPNLWFNVGRSYEALGELEKAIKAYRQCALDPAVAPQSKARAEQRAAVLVAALARTRRADSGVGRATQREATGAVLRAQASDAGVHGSITERSFAPWNWIALGLGIAIGVTGGVLIGMGQADHNDLSELAGYGDSKAILDMSRTDASALIDRGNHKKIAGYALVGVGGAAVVTAAVLFLLGRTDTRGRAEARRVMLDGVSLPGGAAVTLNAVY